MSVTTCLDVTTFEVGDRIKLGFEGTKCVDVTCNESADITNRIFHRNK